MVDTSLAASSPRPLKRYFLLRLCTSAIKLILELLSDFLGVSLLGDYALQELRLREFAIGIHVPPPDHRQNPRFSANLSTLGHESPQINLVDEIQIAVVHEFPKPVGAEIIRLDQVLFEYFDLACE